MNVILSPKLIPIWHCVVIPTPNAEAIAWIYLGEIVTRDRIHRTRDSIFGNEVRPKPTSPGHAYGYSSPKLRSWLPRAPAKTASTPREPVTISLQQPHALPSATLGKEAPSNLFTVKPALPSAKSRALGKGFAECQAGTRQMIDGRWPKAHAVLIFF